MKLKLPLVLLCTLVSLFSARLGAQDTPQKTQVQILGTLHLSQFKGFKPAMLDELQDLLYKKSFDVICVESMPSELLYDIRSRKDSAFAGVISAFGGNRLVVADSVQHQLGISFVEAQQQVKALSQRDTLTDAARLALIEYDLAAAAPASATLNYMQLQDKQILKQSALDQSYFDALEKNKSRSNETYSIAVQLAAKQNLNTIELIDNFQDEALLLKLFPNFIEEFTTHQENFKDMARLPVFVKSEALRVQSIEENDLMAYYSFINSDEYMRQDFEAQWNVWFSTHFESGADKARYYLWEMRNLQIAANILKVVAVNPGKKILVIIGASHKSFLEKYLNEVTNLEVLGFE